MFLPAEIIAVMSHFAPAFTRRSYEKAVVLIIGTILAKGRRTVTGALRAVGKGKETRWSKYHHLLNRARWSGLQVGQILLNLIVNTLLKTDETITIAVDETLERRWGPKIQKRGYWRDSVASSRRLSVSTSGLRWLVFAVVVELPWTPYVMALPFFSVLLTTPKVSEKLGKRHKTVAQVTGQVVGWLRRSLPGRAIHLVGDGAYAVIALGLQCKRHQVTLIAPLRLDARLFEAPCRPLEKRPGRPPVVGTRLPNPGQVAADPHTRWHRSRVDWYQGQTAMMDWTSGTALWYSTGTKPLPIRWVLLRDPAGNRPTRAFFSTDINLPPTHIVGDFVHRWSIEVTFEESRAHLGIETQRQWSNLAIERSTPALFGLFSLVVLMAHALSKGENLPLSQDAWYSKTHAGFHDILNFVRRRIWLQFLFQTGGYTSDMRLFTANHLELLLSAACY